ncbi:pilus assembly protein [Glycocaulis profundi]|nr:pilus assembly protein [Glycocaulis profundi]
MSRILTALTRQFAFLRTLRGDRRGVSALEFALLAPLMIALYAGVVQISLAIEANRKFNLSVNQVADLVSQATDVDDSELYEYFAAGRVVMMPFDSEALRMRITSVRRDASGNVNLVWSEARGDGFAAHATAPATPAGFMPNGQGAVVVDHEFDYATPFVNSQFYSFTFSETAQRRPRMTDWVTRNGGSGSGGGAGTSGSGGSSGQGSGGTSAPAPAPAPEPEPEPEPAPTPPSCSWLQRLFGRC